MLLSRLVSRQESSMTRASLTTALETSPGPPGVLQTPSWITRMLMLKRARRKTPRERPISGVFSDRRTHSMDELCTYTNTCRAMSDVVRSCATLTVPGSDYLSSPQTTRGSTMRNDPSNNVFHLRRPKLKIQDFYTPSLV